jgi:hypothetical protein
MPRSGTTLIEQIIAGHPVAAVGGVGERGVRRPNGRDTVWLRESWLSTAIIASPLRSGPRRTADAPGTPLDFHRLGADAEVD